MSTAEKIARIPLMLAGQALRALRDAGYTLAAALGELIDNAVEANANSIRIKLFEAEGPRGKKQIVKIACADDGDGMGDVLAYYLQLGFSTRWMSRTTIGKYGVGAKFAALNFCQRIDVWSRTSETEPWRHVHLDVAEVEKQEVAGEEVGFDPPEVVPVPEELKELLPAKSGTLVVWSDIDKLEEGRYHPDVTSLRVEIEKELSRMFRTFLEGGIRIAVNETELLPHDPLFLMEGTWADKVLSAYVAKEMGDGAKQKKGANGHYAATVIANREEIPVAGSKAFLTVTLYPREVLRKRGKGGDELARKLRVPENQGSISFMRLGREINYTNVPRIFPRGVEKPDRFIGIEVSFAPELDEYFGVRNVKRGVEPHDELRVKLRKRLEKHVPQARTLLEEVWGEFQRETQSHAGEHSAVADAAGEANRALPKSRAKGPVTEEDVNRIYDDLATDVGKTSAEERKEYLERIRQQPFIVEAVDFPGQLFIEIQHVDGKVIIRLNTRHRFYREMWEPIHGIAESLPGSVSGDEAVRTARRTLEALTLMVIAYGKAESMHENPQDQYGELRGYWGQFLDSLMGKVKDVL